MDIQRSNRYNRDRLVIDVDFAEQAGERRIVALHCARGAQSFTHDVGPDDYAFITIGSMTADSRNGDDAHAPELVRGKQDGAWALWETMARKVSGLGRPYAFRGNVDESKWESFTLTMAKPTVDCAHRGVFRQPARHGWVNDVQRFKLADVHRGAAPAAFR